MSIRNLNNMLFGIKSMQAKPIPTPKPQEEEQTTGELNGDKLRNQINGADVLNIMANQSSSNIVRRVGFDETIIEFNKAFKAGEYTLDEAKEYLESIGAENVKAEARGTLAFGTEEVTFELNGKTYTASRRTSPLVEKIINLVTSEEYKTAQAFKEAFEGGEYTLDEAKEYLESIGATEIEAEASGFGPFGKETITYKLDGWTSTVSRKKDFMKEKLENLVNSEEYKTAQAFKEAFEGGEYTLDEAKEYLESIGATEIEAYTLGFGPFGKETITYKLAGWTYKVNHLQQ